MSPRHQDYHQLTRERYAKTTMMMTMPFGQVSPSTCHGVTQSVGGLESTRDTCPFFTT